MKILKINNRDYVLKFTAKVVKELNAKGITLSKLTEDMEAMRIDNLYDAFVYGVKDINSLSYDESLNLIDLYFEEDDNDIETFFILILEEYSKAMGLGKKFKELLSQQVQKTE